jgi:hypothetical protein
MVSVDDAGPRAAGGSQCGFDNAGSARPGATGQADPTTGSGRATAPGVELNATAAGTVSVAVTLRWPKQAATAKSGAQHWE